MPIIFLTCLLQFVSSSLLTCVRKVVREDTPPLSDETQGVGRATPLGARGGDRRLPPRRQLRCLGAFGGVKPEAETSAQVLPEILVLWAVTGGFFSPSDRAVCPRWEGGPASFNRNISTSAL